MIILLSCVLGWSAFAQEPTKAPDLDKAFQREYVYLVSQKEALERQIRQVEQTFTKRTRETQAQVTSLQKRVSNLAANNDEAHEELMTLERQKKDLQKRGSSLESTYKKSVKLLNETELALRFESGKDSNTDALPPEDLKLKDLGPLFARAGELLRSASEEQTLQAAYLDGSDQLVQGEITRLGRVAAFVTDHEGRKLLGPTGTGQLKVIETTQTPALYVFENMNEAASLKKPGGWIERLADFGPAMFLALMMALVAGLFVVMVKI